MNGKSVVLVLILMIHQTCHGAVDMNGNGQSDVWEMIFNAPGMSASGDADGDGFTNADESAAGTDPKDAGSHPQADIHFQGGLPEISWQGERGKMYVLMSSDILTTFAPTGNVAAGNGGEMTFQLPPPDAHGFFRMAISDMDGDGDGVNDWEEYAIGFDSARSHTDRYTPTDAARVVCGAGRGECHHGRGI